jgi:DNA-binding protein YbaB
MPGNENDNTDVRRRLSGMIDQLSRLRDVREQLAELHAEGEAADGLVGVTVGPTGALTNVRIDPRAMRLDSQTLAEAVMEAARQATSHASERAGELFAGISTGLDMGALMTTGTTPTAGDADDPAAAIERLRGLIT